MPRASLKPFKEIYGPELFGQLARALSKIEPALKTRRFRAQALEGLEELELQQRMARGADLIARRALRSLIKAVSRAAPDPKLTP